MASSRVDNLHPDAFAIRPVRIVNDEFRYYEATTFPKNPREGVHLCLRRTFLSDGGTPDDNLLLDILNRDGDIIQDYPVTKEGFEYLRRTLKFKVEGGQDDETQ